MAFVFSPGLSKRQGYISPLVTRRSVSLVYTGNRKRRAMITGSAAVEKGSGMRIIKGADEETITKLGCRSWGKWGCEPSTFPWTYSDDEVCLVLEGEFTVILDGGGESMEVQAGDIAFFPKGMSCTWEVRKTVDKHFVFGMKL